MADDDRNFWSMTSIGLVIAAIVAVVTGIVVANRTRPVDTRVVVAPSASPATTVDEPEVTRSGKGVPPQSVVVECNRVAASMGEPARMRDEKSLNAGGMGSSGAGTLYGINANKKQDERYRAAYVACMKSKGYTA
jgi:hypothetical protein